MAARIPATPAPTTRKSVSMGSDIRCVISSWYNFCMPSFVVQTPQRAYPAVVERGAIASLAGHIPASAGLTFVITTEDVWQAHGHRVTQALDARPHKVLFFPGGEDRKRLSEVECLAEHMVRAGGDRSSVVNGAAT